MQYLQIPEATLRVVVAVMGGLLIVTRLYGMIYPEKLKKLAGKIALWKRASIRSIYLIVSLLGLWVLYSTLVVIFGSIPVYLVFSFMLGLVFMMAGMFVVHPEWFPEIVKGLIVNRGNFFVSVLCFLGVLVGVCILLSAILGWGGLP